MNKRIWLFTCFLAAVCVAVFCIVTKLADAQTAISGWGFGAIPQIQDPGCGGSDAGTVRFCTGFELPDGGGYFNSTKLTNTYEWSASASSFTGGCSEGCVIPDASFTPGDGYLHQVVRMNNAPDAACLAYWPNGAGNGQGGPLQYWVPPTDAGGPWLPTTCNAINIGLVQSKQLFNNPDGGPYVVQTSINNPNVVGLDNSLILYSKATFCPPTGSLDHWACVWSKGYYGGVDIGTFWEIDLTIGSSGILNLYEGSLNYGAKAYTLPGSCNPNTFPNSCNLAVVITPGVSIQVWMNGLNMGVNGNITSSHVPTDPLYLQVGVNVTAPGPGTWVGIVDLRLGTTVVCDYNGEIPPHC